MRVGEGLKTFEVVNSILVDLTKHACKHANLCYWSVIVVLLSFLNLFSRRKVVQ